MFITAQDIGNEKATIIDIRSRKEQDNMSLDAVCTSLPLEELDLTEFIKSPPEGPIYILCHSGGRATMLADFLQQLNIPNVKVIEGGIKACEKCFEIKGPRNLSATDIHLYAEESIQAFMKNHEDEED